MLFTPFASCFKARSLSLALLVLLLLVSGCGDDAADAPIAATPAAATGEPITLSLSLHAGDAWRQRVSVDQEIVQMPQGSKQTTRQRLDITLDYRVTAVKPNDTATVAAVYREVTMQQAGPTRSIERGPSPQARVLEALTGRGFEFDVTPRGEVTAVRGADEALRAVAAEAATLPELVEAGVEPASMHEQLRRQFGDAAMRDLLQQQLAVYPDAAVDNGEAWSVTTRVTAALPMQIDSRYTLTDHDAQRAALAVVSRVSPVAGEAMRMGPLTLRFEVAGSQRGELTLSRDSGWVMRSRVASDLKGTVSATGVPGTTSGERSWPVTIKSVVTSESHALEPQMNTDEHR